MAANEQPGPDRDGAFTYLAVDLPPAHEVDYDWCADFTSAYGRRGYRYSGKARCIFANDTPPEFQQAGAATSYSSYFLPGSKVEGDVIDGEVVGARIVPFYLFDEDTDSLDLDSPDLVPHIILANAFNLTHLSKLARTVGDLMCVEFDPDLPELILYY